MYAYREFKKGYFVNEKTGNTYLFLSFLVYKVIFLVKIAYLNMKFVKFTRMAHPNPYRHLKSCLIKPHLRSPPSPSFSAPFYQIYIIIIIYNNHL